MVTHLQDIVSRVAWIRYAKLKEYSRRTPEQQDTLEWLEKRLPLLEQLRHKHPMSLERFLNRVQVIPGITFEDLLDLIAETNFEEL